MPVEPTDIKAVFKKCDANQDGVISKGELNELFSQLGLSQAGLDELLKTCDADGNGKLNYNEFVDTLWPSASKVGDLWAARKAFNRVDKDGKGGVSCKEFLTCSDLPAQFKKLKFAESDADKDRALTWNEFLSHCKQEGLVSETDMKQILHETIGRKDRAVMKEQVSELERLFQSFGGVSGKVTLKQFFMSTSSSPLLKGFNFSNAAGEDKVMDFAEFKAALVAKGMILDDTVMSNTAALAAAKELHAAFVKVDKSGNGMISIREFMTLDLPAAFKGIVFADAAGSDRKMSWTEMVNSLVKLGKFSEGDAKSILAATASAADKKVVSNQLAEAQAIFDKMAGADKKASLGEFMMAPNCDLFKGFDFSLAAGKDKNMTFGEFKDYLIQTGKIPEGC